METLITTNNKEQAAKEAKDKRDKMFLDVRVSDNETTISQILKTQSTHTREIENVTKTTTIHENKLINLDKCLQEKMDNMFTKMMEQFASIQNKPPEAIIQTSKRSRMSSLTASNQTSPSKRTQDQVHQEEDQAQKKLCTQGTANMSMEEDLESRPDDDPEKGTIVF